MSLIGFLDGIIFTKKIRFGGPRKAEKAAYKKKWDAKCASCGTMRRDHMTANHTFQEGGE